MNRIYILDGLISCFFWGSVLCVPLFYNNNTVLLGDIITNKTNGLLLGAISVLIGQLVTVSYYMCFPHKEKIHDAATKSYSGKDVWRHFTNPEGFALLACYLSIFWMGNLFPTTYYLFDRGIQWNNFFAFLLLQDFLQFVVHCLEHRIISFYKWSHYKHHKHTKPILFDSFDGSCLDTVVMILFPLTITVRLINANGLTFIAFGTIYASQLTLIHSEYKHHWDPFFQAVGFGTSYEHYIHHKMRIYNYGHLFMYWDYLLGTYNSGSDLQIKS